MRIAGILPTSSVDGPGLCTVVFVQGCPHHCKGCHNPDTWDPDGGQDMTFDQIFADIAQHADVCTGLTVSGGEPFSQLDDLMWLVDLYKRVWPNHHITVYTGYTLDQLLHKFEFPKLFMVLDNIDYLIDGPYIAALKAELPYRGSSNQRFIDLRKEVALTENYSTNDHTT